jgi:ABC-type transport system substrate-binding protein
MFLILSLVFLAAFSDAVADDVNTGTLRVALAGLGDVPTLDPARAATAVPVIIGWQVYQRLVGIKPDGGLAPMLATGWRSNPKMTEWRFDLRKNVFFHAKPGKTPRKFTARDAKASIERALRVPGYGRAVIGNLVIGAKKFIKGKAKDITGIRIENGELLFKLTKTFAFFPDRLASSFFAIVPQGTSLDDSAPPGTGPYRITKWDRLSGKVSLELVSRNWTPVTNKSPKRLSFRVYESVQLAVEELRAGNVDWLEATSDAKRLVDKSLDPSVFSISSPEQTVIRLIAINRLLPRFTKYPELAVALNFAVDRARIVKALGGGVAVGGPVPSGRFKNRGYWTDKPLARTIVKTLPPDERRIELLVQPGAESRIIAELVTQDWREVGINVVLKQGMSNFFSRLVKGKYETALAYFGPFINAPEPYLWPYRAEAQPVPNVMRYRSAAFQTAYQRYISLPGSTGGSDGLRAAVDAVLRDPPMIWLVKPPHIVAVRGFISAPRSAAIPQFYSITVTK